MALCKPILQLKADYDSTKLTTVRLIQMYADGTTVKQDIPQTDGTSIEAMLHCIQEYQETADEINLDGDKLFILTFVAPYVELQRTIGTQ
jgi:hypothetical protein